MEPGLIQRLPVLVLQTHSRCNCRCVMCDIWKTAAARELNPLQLERHLADIEALGVESVVFTGGEPLMHSDFFRLCRLLRDKGIRGTLLSSGLLLGRYADAIAADVDEVIVSLDGPRAIHDEIRRVKGGFDLLAAGVRKLRALAPKLPIAGRCTVQRLNFLHLRETVESARGIGLDSISFLAADLASTAFDRLPAWGAERQAEVGLTAEEIVLLAEEMEALIRDCAGYPDYVRETPEKLRRIVRHFRAHRGLEEPVAPRCNAPWISAVVELDGAVRPCFFQPPIGKLNGGGLLQVLNSPGAIEFRRRLDIARDPICRRCVCSLYRDDAVDGDGQRA